MHYIVESWLDHMEGLLGNIEALAKLLKREPSGVIRVGSICTGAGTDHIFLDCLNEAFQQRGVRVEANLR